MRCAVKWLHPKSTDQNLMSAFVHMVSVSLLSMSLVELRWFEIATTPQQQEACAPFLSMTQFFTYGYTTSTTEDDNACLNATTVNMIRIIILLVFMAIAFSLCGFYVEVAGGSSPARGHVAQFVRRYALMNTCTVLWVMAIVASCYYVAILLEEAFLRAFPLQAPDAISVTYGCGFYLVAVSGALNLFGTFLSLLFMHHSNRSADDMSQDNSFLISRATEAPPPYNIPPPPYHP